MTPEERTKEILKHMHTFKHRYTDEDLALAITLAISDAVGCETSRCLEIVKHLDANEQVVRQAVQEIIGTPT